MLPERRYFFSSFAGSFAGSAGGVAEGAAPLGCGLAPLLAEPEPLALSLFGFSALALSLFGFSALALSLFGFSALELLGGVALAPPDADEGGVAPLEDEPGVVAEVPPEAEPDDEPGAVEGALLGEGALLELEEPGVEEVLLASRSQAASPKAIATAIVRVESFMCPPWLGYERKQQYARPD